MLATSDKTTVYAEIKGNSFQDHLRREINNAKSGHDIERIFKAFAFCDKIDQRNEQDAVCVHIYHSEQARRHINWRMYRKKEILNEIECKQAIISDETKLAMMNNALFFKEPRFIKYISGTVDESAPNRKENLRRLVDRFWSFDKLIDDLEKENCNVSKELLYQVMHERILTLCDRKEDNNESDIDIELQRERDDEYLSQSDKVVMKGSKFVKYSTIEIDWNVADAVNEETLDYASRSKNLNQYKKLLKLLCQKENGSNDGWYLEINSRDKMPDIDERLYQQFLDKNGESHPKNKSSNNCNNNATKSINQLFDGTDQRKNHALYLFEANFNDSNFSKNYMSGNARIRK